MIMLVDGNNILYRVSNIKDLWKLRNGAQFVGATYGFLRVLRLYITQLKPKRCIVVWDGGVSKERVNLHPEYKDRTPKSKLSDIDAKFISKISDMYKIQYLDDKVIKNIVNKYASSDVNKEEVVKSLIDSKKSKSLNTQKISINELLSALGVKVTGVKGMEADDVIYRLAIMYSNLDKKVVILSDDKDFYNIVNKNISIYRPGNKERIDINNIKNITGMTPVEYLYYKTLIGDPSDNIKGIMSNKNKAMEYAKELAKIDKDPHKGYSKACLMKKYKDAEFCLKKSLVINNVRLIDLSKQTMKKGHIAGTLNDINQNNKNYKKVYAIFNSLGFKEMLKNFGSWVQPFNSIN